MRENYLAPWCQLQQLKELEDLDWIVNEDAGGDNMNSMKQWEGLTVGTTPDAKVSLSIVGDFGLPAAEGCFSLNTAKLLAQNLEAAVSSLILPTQAFRWEEPAMNFKESAVLRCEDPRYVGGLPDAPNLPTGLAGLQSPTSRIVGYVLQQRVSGGAIPEGQYIAAATPAWAPVGYNDFEDAQAAVCAAIKRLGIS